MRILITTATYLPSTNGVAYVVAQTKDELIRQGHKVLVFAPQNGKKRGREKNVMYYPSIPNPIIPSEYPVGMPLVSFKNIEVFKPDVIQTHHPIMVGNLSVFLSQKYRLPLFFSFNSDYEEYFKTYFTLGNKLWQKVLTGYLKRFASNVTTVIAPSSHIMVKLKKMGIKNSVVVPNGISLDLFKPANKRLPNLSLVFVGRLEKEKRPMDLIDLAWALKNLPTDFQLTIVGTGLLEKELRQVVNDKKLNKEVRFVGRTSREKVSKLLPKNHFFISYSHSETFSLSHLEAQASGLVLLVPPRVKLGDYAHKDNVLALPRDYNKAAKKILKLFKNKNRYAQLVDKGLNISKDYSIQVTTKKLVDVFNKQK